MRLSTIFISSAFVLAGMSAALPIERENMLMARFADSDFLAEVEARTYDEEPELYARGFFMSKPPKEQANRPIQSRPIRTPISISEPPKEQAYRPIQSHPIRTPISNSEPPKEQAYRPIQSRPIRTPISNLGLSSSSLASSVSRERPPTHPSSRADTDSSHSTRPPSPFTAAEQRSRMEAGSSGTALTHFHASPNRRSFYEMPHDELTRRGFRSWVKNAYSKVTGFFGGSGTPAQSMAQPMGYPQ